MQSSALQWPNPCRAVFRLAFQAGTYAVFFNVMNAAYMFDFYHELPF
jgi:hypothetical protein